MAALRKTAGFGGSHMVGVIHSAMVGPAHLRFAASEPYGSQWGAPCRSCWNEADSTCSKSPRPSLSSCEGRRSNHRSDTPTVCQYFCGSPQSCASPRCLAAVLFPCCVRSWPQRPVTRRMPAHTLIGQVPRAC
jgi:hypothetical protein